MALDKQLLQEIMCQRGYLVMADYRKRDVGYVVMHTGIRTEDNGPIESLGTSVVVIGRAEHADFVEQARLMGDTKPFTSAAPYYYRVAAE